MDHLLDNIFWQALSGPHACFATGTASARRYAPGFSPIVGFPDPSAPDFDALRPFCAPGEHFYCDGWTGPAPNGWRIEAESTMYRMVWNGVAPTEDAAPDALPLGPGHAPLAVELAALMKPGPFGPRTIELGDYFGYFDDSAGCLRWLASGWRRPACARSVAYASVPNSRAAAWPGA